MDNLEHNIFGVKKFKDLFSEIYDNQKKKANQISTLINELKPMITSIGDATLLVPLIKEYLEIGVKNDEQLIKMATILQRCIAVNNTINSGDGFSISDEEKNQLLNDINKLQEDLKPKE